MFKNVDYFVTECFLTIIDEEDFLNHRRIIFVKVLSVHCKYSLLGFHSKVRATILTYETRNSKYVCSWKNSTAWIFK